MKNMKRLLIFALCATGVLIQSGCLKNYECKMYHFTNPDIRPATSFTDDTLSMRELVDNYYDLVSGDTLILTGYVNHSNYEVVPHHDYSIPESYYLCDYDPREGGMINYLNEYEQNYDLRYVEFYQEQWGKGPVAFFHYLHMPLWPKEIFSELPEYEKVVVKGTVHFEHFGNGIEYFGLANRGGCEEQAYFEIVNWELNKQNQTR